MNDTKVNGWLHIWGGENKVHALRRFYRDLPDIFQQSMLIGNFNLY